MGWKKTFYRHIIPFYHLRWTEVIQRWRFSVGPQQQHSRVKPSAVCTSRDTVKLHPGTPYSLPVCSATVPNQPKASNRIYDLHWFPWSLHSCQPWPGSDFKRLTGLGQLPKFRVQYRPTPARGGTLTYSRRRRYLQNSLEKENFTARVYTARVHRPPSNWNWTPRSVQ